VCLGAGTADLLRNEDFYRTWITAGLPRTRRSDVWNHFPSTPVDVIAQQFGLEGPRACVVAACSSSTIAIGRGVEAIRSGRADAVLAGGTDALSRLTYSGFNLLRLMDVAPCRPFDRSRAGMNIGEGAGILVLEDLDRARRRGATIYAELAGHGLACEAFHPTAPEPEGRPIAAVVRLALDDAGINVDEVQHINAHGTATPQNDAAEARGFRRVFGERVGRIPVTSIKSMIGHCLGAAGAVEAAALALTIARGAIPPTIHHEETDGDCAVDVVANEAREHPVRCGVSTSLGFAGNDSAIVMKAI
jgi:3-oxoacyl-[acyl-carrier-protein] synthase II